MQNYHRLSVLFEADIVDRKENVLALGPLGSGKIHLVCGLGRSLVFRRHRAEFYHFSTLLRSSFGPGGYCACRGY